MKEILDSIISSERIRNVIAFHIIDDSSPNGHELTEVSTAEPCKGKSAVNFYLKIDTEDGIKEYMYMKGKLEVKQI